MAPGGALEPLVKEMLYLAVSTTNGCEYCIRSHTAAAREAGMSEAMLGELMAVVGMANETNRLANGYQVEVDAQFMDALVVGRPVSDGFHLKLNCEREMRTGRRGIASWTVKKNLRSLATALRNTMCRWAISSLATCASRLPMCRAGNGCYKA